MTRLFDRLRSDAAAEWQAFVAHAFVRGIADGTLPRGAFEHYLRQDYRFLFHFARAHALAAFKADTIEEMRSAAETMQAVIDVEMRMHVEYCARWGVGEAELDATVEDEATIAYTRYVLDRGVAGDALDLHTALAPCVVGYGEIGAALARDPRTKHKHNPYSQWIATYAGDAYQSVTDAAAQRLDGLFVRRGGEARYPSLLAVFRDASRLEAAFWDMGLAAAAVE